MCVNLVIFLELIGLCLCGIVDEFFCFFVKNFFILCILFFCSVCIFIVNFFIEVVINVSVVKYFVW